MPTPNAARQRPCDAGVRHRTEGSSRGPLHALCWAEDLHFLSSYPGLRCGFGVYAPKGIGNVVQKPLHSVLQQLRPELRDDGFGAGPHFTQGDNPVPFGIFDGGRHLLEQHRQGGIHLTSDSPDGDGALAAEIRVGLVERVQVSLLLT